LSEIKHKLKSVSDNIFGNILESIIGAIYLDLGYNESKKFIFNQIIEKSNFSEDINYKSKILEWCQKKNKKIKFVNSKQKGPDHKKEYFIELYIQEKKISESWGNTIKSAEQKSAEIAIKIVS
ncbi:MAG: ribonuclease III, partial [Flavobacteriales bacterium]|nr:ribonuclease III [Flavobacteriales bacterium]